MTRRPCATCGRNRAPHLFPSPRARICTPCQTARRAATAHAGRVARTYGLSAEGYSALLAHQGGVCAICRGARRYRLHVDHDHATGAVRGLLCKADNRLLAVVRDNPERLQRAAAYLVSPPAQNQPEGIARCQ